MLGEWTKAQTGPEFAGALFHWALHIEDVDGIVAKPDLERPGSLGRARWPFFSRKSGDAVVT